MADDFTTNFLKKYGADDTISKLVNTKPLYDPYKMASDTINQTNKEITNLVKIQSDLEERKQAAIDAQNKKLQEAQLISDFNNYQDGLNKTITGLEYQVGRPLNDDERIRVYSTFQKQLVDGLKSVGRKDLAGEAMVKYDPKMLYSFDQDKIIAQAESVAQEAKAKKTGAFRHWVGDTAVQAATGFMDMIGNIEDIAGSATGADFLSNEAKAVYKTNQDIRDALLSDRAKQDAKDAQDAMAKAEAEGSVVGQALSYLEDPTAVIGSLIGSVGGAGLAVKGTTKLGAKAIAKGLAKESTVERAGGIGFGALQGGGSVVNTQRQTAIQDALKAGYTQEEAEVIGDKAAEFNAQQAIGIGLGGLAGSNGAEALFFKKATDGAVKTILKDGGSEAITEALQGGQEQYAGNIASINQGLIAEDQAMRGVAGNALGGGLVGALGGGAFGGLHALTSRTPNTNITVDEIALDGTDNPPTAPTAPTVTPAQRVDLRASISENGVDGSEQLKAMAKQAGVTPVELANQLGIIAQDDDGNVTTFTDTTPDDIKKVVLSDGLSAVHKETTDNLNQINKIRASNPSLTTSLNNVIDALNNDVPQAKQFLVSSVRGDGVKHWDSQYVTEGIDNIKSMNAISKSTLADMNESVKALKELGAYNENPVVQPQSNVDTNTGEVTGQAQVDTANALQDTVAPTPVNVTQEAGKVAVEKTPADNTNYAEKGNAYEVALNDHVNNSTDGYSQPADVKKAIIVIKNSPVGGNQEVTNAVKLVESEFANRGIKLPKVNTTTAPPDGFELAKQLQSAIDNGEIKSTKEIADAIKVLSNPNGNTHSTLVIKKAIQDATTLLGKVNNTNDVSGAEWKEYVKTGKVTDERVQAIADKVINGETPTTKEAQMVAGDDANTRFEAILTAERAKSNNTDDNTETNTDGNLKDWIVAKFTRPKNDDGKDDSKHKVDEIPDDKKKPVTEQDAKEEVKQSKDKEQKDGSVKYDKAILLSEYEKLIAKQKQDEQDKKDATEQKTDAITTDTTNTDTDTVPDATTVSDTTIEPANDVQTPVTDNELLTPADVVKDGKKNKLSDEEIVKTLLARGAIDNPVLELRIRSSIENATKAKPYSIGNEFNNSKKNTSSRVNGKLWFDSNTKLKSEPTSYTIEQILNGTWVDNDGEVFKATNNQKVSELYARGILSESDSKDWIEAVKARNPAKLLKLERDVLLKKYAKVTGYPQPIGLSRKVTPTADEFTLEPVAPVETVTPVTPKSELAEVTDKIKAKQAEASNKRKAVAPAKKEPKATTAKKSEPKVAPVKEPTKVTPVKNKGKVIIDEDGNLTGELSDRFENLKAENDRKGLDELYSTVRILLNGIAQSKGDNTVKQVNSLKQKIEDYAKQLSTDTENKTPIVKKSPPKVSKATKKTTVKVEPVADVIPVQIDTINESNNQKVTQEQKNQAENHAKDLGGAVVWQDGDIALIRGYSLISGQPVYAVSKGSLRSKIDIELYTGDLITQEQKAKLISVKNEIETADAKKHADNPFVKFNKDGVAFSDSIDHKISGIITGWKNLLNLTPNVYFTTIDDARKNKDNFTGNHRAIASSALDSNENGSIRKIGDDYYIAFKQSTSPSKMLEVLAHEIGHLHQRYAYDKAPADLKKKIRDEHEKFVNETKGGTARNLIDSLRAKATGRATQTNENKLASELTPYWSSFSEWYADQVSRWAVSYKKPTNVVEQYFSRLGKALRNFYQSLRGQKFLPSETMGQYLDSVSKSVIITDENSEVVPTDTLVEQTPVENKNQAHDILSNEFNTLSEDEQASIRKQYRKELPYSSNEDGSKYTIWNFISEKVTEYFSNPDKFDELSTVGEQFDWKNAIIKIGNALQNAKKAIGAIIMSVAIANGVISNDANANPVNIDTIVQNQQITNDANVVNSFVTKNKDNDGKKYIIADKKAGVMYVMNADGSLAITTTALFGKDVGDNATSGQTPAGKFKLKVVTTKQGDVYGGSVQGFTRGSFGEVYAIHRVITSNAKENRIGRLNSKTANDNRVSKGCINVPAKFYDENLDGNFDGNVYIIPETTSIDAMFGGALFSRRRKANAKKGTVKIVEDALTSMFGVKDIKDLNNVNVIKSISEFGSVADIQKAVDNGQLSVIGDSSLDKNDIKNIIEAVRYGVFKKTISNLIKQGKISADKRVAATEFANKYYAINEGRLKNKSSPYIKSLDKRLEEFKLDKKLSEIKKEFPFNSLNDSEFNEASVFYDPKNSGTYRSMLDDAYRMAIDKIESVAEQNGWSVDHKSKGRGNSVYLKKGDRVVRISDHELPSTSEREYNRSIGYTGRWSDEIILGYMDFKNINDVFSYIDDIGKLQQSLSEDISKVQGFYDPKTDKITMIAENLNSADDARAVFLHEVGHRSMKKTIGAEKWNRLHDMVSSWKDAKVGSIENDVYTKAKRSADASGETGDRLKDELIQYAVEEAYRAGIEPDAKVFNEKTVAGFMASVWRSFTNAMKKLNPNFKGYLTGKDLVNIAYGVANNDVFSDTNTSQNEAIAASKKDQDAEIVAQYATEDGAPTEAQIREARQQIRDVEAKYSKELADGSWVNLTPTGKPSELTKGQWVQVRTDNFKKWFGDWENDPANASKVVNKVTGEPLVLFHGSKGKFTAFDPIKLSENTGNDGHYGAGFYFSVEKAEAITYGSNVFETFLNIRNPVRNNNESLGPFAEKFGYEKKFKTVDKKWLADEIAKKDPNAGILAQLFADGYAWGNVWEEFEKRGGKYQGDFDLNDVVDVFENIDESLRYYGLEFIEENIGDIPESKKTYGYDKDPDILDITDRGISGQWFTSVVSEAGHDGVIAGSEYVAFNPNQIKSAVGNVGTFDNTSNDIRFSMSRDEMLAYDGVKPVQKEAILNSAKKKIQDSKDSLLKMAGAVVSKGDGLPKMTKLAMLLKGTRLANESWAFRTADMDSVVDWTKHLFNNLLAAYVRAIKTQGADVRAKIEDFHNAVGKYLYRPDIKAQHDTLSELFVGATKENYDPSGTFKTKLGATKNAKLDTLYNSLSEPAQQTYKNTLIFFRNQFNRELKAFEQSLRDAGHDEAYIDKLLSEIRKVEVYVPLRQYGNRVMSVYVRNADGSNGEALAHEFFDGKINIAFTEMRMKAEFKKMFGDNINVTQITEFREKLRPSLSASQNDVIDAHAARLRQNGLSEAEVDAQIAEFVKTLSSFGIAKLDQTKQERTGVYSSGFKRDIFKAINDVASTNEMRIASLVHKKTITDAFNAAQEHIKKESLNPDYDGLSADMALKAIRESFDYRASSDGLQAFVTKLNGFGFLATMGFDMSQIPLQLSSLMNLALPHLVSRFPKDKAFATKQMGKNFYAVLKMVRYGGMNEYLNVLSEKASKGDSEAKKLFDSLKPAYEQMRANDRVSFTDLKEIENEIYGKTNLMSNILRYSGMQINITDQVVNMSIAMTTIQLAEKNGMNQSEVDFQVDEALRRGNPNSTTTTKGLYSKTAIGRFATIMRSYGMAVFARQMSDLRTVWRLKGTGSTDFKEARNRLVATIVIQGTMAGAVGMPTFLTFPLWIMLSVAKAMTADDDEEELSTDQWTRKIFYETFGSDATRVMRYGMLSFVGGDALAKRMSFDDLIVRNTDDDLNGDGIRDYMDDLSANAPLTGGVTDRSVRAFSRFYNDIKAGRPMDDVFDELLRKNLPMKSINSIAKAYDAMQNDGQVYSKDNTPLLSEKNKLNILERVAMALGIRPAMVMEAQNNKWELISAKIEKEQQKKAMLDNYKIVYAQFKQGIADQSDVDDAKEMIDEYNAKNPLYEISAKSIANAQKKLTVNMENSIITPRNKTDKAKIDEVINSNPWLNPEEEL